MTRAKRIIVDSGLVGLCVVTGACIGIVFMLKDSESSQAVAIAAVGAIVAVSRLKSAAKRQR